MQHPRPRIARLVPQKQPPVAIQTQHQHERSGGFLDRRYEEELAPDLELKDDRVPTVQLHDKMLRSPPCSGYGRASEPPRKFFGRDLFNEGGVEDAGFFYLGSHDELA